ncbi:MAG: serine hydrolase domain-containing protein [Candidatus Dormibacteraceae bacterium]
MNKDEGSPTPNSARRLRLAIPGVVVMVVLLCAACGAVTSSHTPTSTEHAIPAPVRTRLNRLVTQYAATNHDPGILVEVWSPMGHYLEEVGVSDLVTGAAISANMQYEIGSQTKTFVSLLILQLVAESKVGLGDHISKWIPGVPNGDQITIRELLKNTSGLGDVLSAPAIEKKWEAGKVCTPDELLAAGATLPPEAAPGTKWIYSNYGYDLLGRVVELATHQSFATVVQQRIVRPLGLHRTYFPTSETSGSGLTAPFTHGYGFIAPTAAPTASDDISTYSLSCGWAAGAIVSTLSDMRAWAKAFATGALLKPAVWKEAQLDLVPIPGAPFSLQWGLGFAELPGRFLGWGGDTLGFSTATMYSAQHQTTIGIVVNKQNNSPSNIPFFHNLAMAMFPSPGES